MVWYDMVWYGIHIRRRSCIHAFIHKLTHTLINSYTHTLIHSYTHTLIHSYIHTLIHSYTHTFRYYPSTSIQYPYIHTYCFRVMLPAKQLFLLYYVLRALEKLLLGVCMYVCVCVRVCICMICMIV